MMNKSVLFTLVALLCGVGYGCSQADGTTSMREAADVAPVEDRFTKVVLDANLYEPMELDLLDDGRILFVERRGAVKLYDPRKGETEVVAQMEVFTTFEEGLLGVAVDPNYADNRWVYFAYSAPDEPVIRLARFVFDGTTLDRASEKVLLEVPVQREQCCHVAGSVEFDPDGNLYLSIGDNTNPFASDGFAPIDERDGRSPWDAQQSSANTNDLRGKILRITPQPDGTYTIPDGNLFAPGDSLRRPEIYVMGNRNPFRMAIDARTGFLYWGEVGPDAGEDSTMRGPKGHDEINQARQAGNFGWPYFVGDNKPYHDYDFAAETSGAAYDPAAPVNTSPNNTGLDRLPPAQSAFIWYPYGPSEVFPEVGEGGRNAMAGPVYHYDDYAASDRKFPAYYDGKLFTYDWMRGWIMAVTMDDEGDFVAMERFMPSTPFNNPMDMLFGPEGAIYMLEYGTVWNAQNLDARLVRIEYAVNNRAPRARITADTPIGAAPLTVTLSADTSRDPDGDAITAAWTLGGEAVPATDGLTATVTLDEPGVYTARLTVTDTDGLTATDELTLRVGNDIPRVALEVDGNRSFFWDDGALDYRVVVTDTEDGSLADGGIAPEQVALTIDYLAEGADLTISAQGHQAALETATALVGKALIDGSDCQACHQPATASIGPSYTAIAQRYQDEPGAVDYLAEKIINGGGGVWGDQAMAAHPQLTGDEAARMVAYILSLGDDAAPVPSAPLDGTYATAAHKGTGEAGRYIITATYTDRGGSGIGPLTGRDVLIVRHPRLQAEAADAEGQVTTFSLPADTLGLRSPAEVAVGTPGASLTYEGIDLTEVSALTVHVGLLPGVTTGGRLEVRRENATGPLIGALDLDPNPTTAGFSTYAVPLEPTAGPADLVLVFTNPQQPDGDRPVGVLDWVYAHHRDGPQPR